MREFKGPQKMGNMFFHYLIYYRGEVRVLFIMLTSSLLP